VNLNEWVKVNCLILAYLSLWQRMTLLHVHVLWAWADDVKDRHCLKPDTDEQVFILQVRFICWSVRAAVDISVVMANKISREKISLRQ
jgi:hypothetical protein